MKNTYPFLIFLLATPLFATNETAVSTSNTTNSPSSGSYETVEAKVLKAYIVSDGGAEFRAYVVMWKGHEVVASDPLAQSKYKEGDTIKILAMRNPYPQGKEDYGLLNFQVLPVIHAKRIIAFTNSVNQTRAKATSYIDCHPDSVVAYPGGTSVSWDELQQPGNLVEKLLDEVQAHKESQDVVVFVRPQTVKFYRAIRNVIEKRSIDARYEAVDADVKMDSDEARKALAATNEAREPASVEASRSPSSGPPVRAVPTNQRPVFFECRGNKVFFIDKDGLDAQAAELMSTLDPNVKGGDRSQFLKAVQSKEIGNENYKMNLTYWQVGLMVLEPRADAPGESREQLDKTDGRFQAALSRFDPKGQYVTFLVRDDSFGVFRKARSIADKQGFNTGWELLGADEPIKFGK
jgi:hypothetical protein